MTFRSKWTVAFGAAYSLLLLVCALSYRRLQQEDSAQRWVAHTHQVMEKLDSTLADSLELQSSAQIAGHEAWTRPRDEAVYRLESDLADIQSLTADNPRQQAAHARLANLIATRIAQFLPGVPPGANEAAEANRQLLGEIQLELLGMRQEEQRLQGERLQRVETETRTARIVLGAGSSFALILLALTAYSVLREVQRRTLSEQQLAAAERQYRLLFDSNPIPVWVYDLETLSILDVNATAINRYGYSREEFLGSKISDIRPTEDVPSLLASTGKENDSVEDSGPWRHRKKSGEIMDVQIRSYPLAFDGRKARLVVATDITEKKKTEDALKESEERFRLIVSNINDYAIISLDPEGRVTSWNGAAERLLGYTTGEIVGKHVSVFYPPGGAAIGKPTIEMKSALEQGRFEDDGWRIRKDGSRFWANVVVTPLRDAAGGLRGFVKITRDTTEKRKAEQELMRRSAELEAANKELEAFSYSVSHDLRAPLRAIDGFSQALHEDYEKNLDATAKNYLVRIRGATHRMGDLIDDLLNLSRVTRAEMHREPIDLSSLAGDVARELQTQDPHRRVTMKVADGLTAEGDSRLMRVALHNLIGNAWKFTSKRPQAEIEFGALKSNVGSTYFVRDNGAGFDQAYASRLFGAFQRLHPIEEFPGTGIGLATVQRIVHRHGGTVWAEGAVNQGATVYFTLDSSRASIGRV